MKKRIRVHHYPVFEKGVFKKYPSLFDAYFLNVPDHIRDKYQEARKSIPRYEKKATWMLVAGPGFCGATHPGTGKIFNGIMTRDTHPAYNSDCVYVNPAQNVFALSDPPGITTFSRGMLTELDRLLKAGSVDNLEAMINEVNRNAGTGLRDRATLALVHIPVNGSNKARIIHSGDSYLFLGSRTSQKLTKLEAVPNRWGTPNAYFKLQDIKFSPGDVFILASDGISAVRPHRQEANIEDVLWIMMNDDHDNFVYNVAQRCNRVQQDKNPDRPRTWFGGGDDVSIMLVDPVRLQPLDSSESYILGGYVV